MGNSPNKRYFKAIKRNLFEIAHALLERKALISIEKYNKKHGIYGENFFSISYRALFNDMVAHSIKVLDEDRESATFWYIFRADMTKLKKLSSYSEEKMKFLRKLASRFKIIRDKTHFHIDKKGVLGPAFIWKNAGIKGRELGGALRYLWDLLNELHGVVFKDNFPHQIDFYDGKDVLKILMLSRRKNLV